MAKAGYIMGGARGKVGDYVFQKGEKGTIQRVKVTPANPKTLAQRKQRMSFAMANSAAAALRFIVNHSFENITGEKNNIREFVRLNSKLLRAEIDRLLAGSGTFNGNAQIKGASGCQAADYIISRGSVYFPEFTGVYDPAPGVNFTSPANVDDLSATITTQAQYEAALNAIGLKPGDELSLVGICTLPTTIATYEGEVNKLSKVIASRVTFVTTLPENFSGKLINEGIINPLLIAEKAGDLDYFILGDSESSIITVQFTDNLPSGYVGKAVGIIRSTKNLNGKYEYSPCQMLFNAPGNDAITVLGSYADSAKAGDSDYFLDQAE